jgi:K+-transporting ATPase ATPase A chain
MHDSFTALGGLVPLVNMQLGEVVFGGVGSGFYGMIEFVVLTVFIAGLMVGRTPEYLGKKIERREVQLAILAIARRARLLAGPDLDRIGAAGRLATLGNNGPHGFSEILYAFTSTNNNGSPSPAWANTFWNISMGVSMLFGRFADHHPGAGAGRALAGKKKSIPPTAGTFTTTRRSSSCC